MTRNARHSRIGVVHAPLTREQIVRSRGVRVSSDAISLTQRVEIDERVYYVKHYSGAGKGFRRFFGRSRPRAERDNLQLFRALGIPTAGIAFWEETRSRGMFREALLVTREIPQARDLATLAANGDPRLRDPHWVRTMIVQIADLTARLHAHGFIHNDLKWRNILVTRGLEPVAHLIDCPLGRHRRAPFRQRGRIKDLASLDKLARKHLSPRDRLSFYLLYTGKPRLEPADKITIRRILRFFAGGTPARRRRRARRLLQRAQAAQQRPAPATDT